uniref:NADH dehydrogenase subunit 6 n=1 Tax=Batocera horsfieldi TaxID=351105 RepID=UPI00257C2803|nr:NADH dehydrogenase subunit 6 [Batocera horsfieldi]WGV34294.1 NADH dehydrogenase subunit 6 [Batocera horsfieldi]
MTIMFSLFLIFLALALMFMNHPLSFGLILLLQTITVALITGLMNYNFWYSYILFLIMIGGMLILFIYMTSIASNEKFSFSNKLMILAIIILIISTLTIMLDSFFMNLISMNDLINQMYTLNYKTSFNKIMFWPMNMIFYLMISYLLITLIMVVKITKTQSGPLRQKN